MRPSTPRRVPLGIVTAGLLAADAAAQAVDYGRDVQPILAKHCFACHGPDAATRMAGLRLDLRDDATHLRGGGTAVIVPGEPSSSEMMRRITDELAPMPPVEVKNPLTPEEVDVLRRWIEGGAPYDQHWAYDAPVAPEAPNVEDASWPTTSVDPFVLARLEAAGRTPAPRADARTLVRRLSFDLTGLPPTPEQVERFAADPNGEAWDALVETFLASPHHAERLTTFWFDLVRFADTTGIHADNRWNVSPYRDWVIDAFQDNMPFDRFTIEQLAGDLLPDATIDQQVAAAYNRLNLITREGGSQPKEFLIRYTADRVRNVSEVWLATTLGCAQCHDHKFDALTTREFYEFGAFFADIEQVGVYTQAAQNIFLPELDVPSKQQEAELARLEDELAALDARLSADSPELDADRRSWEAERRHGDWTVPSDATVETDGDTTLVLQDDGSYLATAGAADRDVYRISFALPDVEVRALRLELLADPSLPREGPGRAANGNLVVGEFEVTLDGEPVAINRADASFEQPNYTIAQAFDGVSGTRAGWAVMQNGSGAPAEGVFEFETPLPASTPHRERRLEVALHQDHGGRHTIGRWRISWTTSSGLGPIAPEERAILAVDSAERTEEDEARLRALHRARTPLLADERAQRDALVVRRDTTRAAVPKVLQTRAVEPMVTRVLPRGDWMDDSGDVVSPGVPAVFGEAPEMSTRLDLARWLVDGRNPVVARVLVNRLWRMLLGHGLAASLDDFGVQAPAPSHPALLDHLAIELVESGWDVRHVIRLIVRSSTYAQASNVGVDEADALFDRQARFRLDAEFVRDNALAVSGLLVRDIGGPSVRPYQPEGYWAHLNFPRRTYAQSTGDDLYRRAIYGHWQRQYLHPSLLAFDAPSRERCTAERPRSNTPLAALALLNDPIFVEAASALAERVLNESNASDDDRVAWLWQRVLQRAPRAEERDLVLALVGSHRAHYDAHRAEAIALIDVGERARDETLDPAEHAAWTGAARVALNLHETIVRR